MRLFHVKLRPHTGVACAGPSATARRRAFWGFGLVGERRGPFCGATLWPGSWCER